MAHTPKIVQTLAQHGGIRSIHVHPVPGGWANTACCYDGFKKRLTHADERVLCNHRVPKWIPA